MVEKVDGIEDCMKLGAFDAANEIKNKINRRATEDSCASQSPQCLARQARTASLSGLCIDASTATSNTASKNQQERRAWRTRQAARQATAVEATVWFGLDALAGELQRAKVTLMTWTHWSKTRHTSRAQAWNWLALKVTMQGPHG